MPWVTPSSVSTGDTLQASEWNQSVVLNSLMGQPVFTNEAARDAAISAPAEGQMCYLTAPTVPAATGGSTYVPSGAVTIYNGSVWVCMSAVGAFTSTGGDTSSSSYTATLGGSPGTNPSVTLVTGTTALVLISAMTTADSAGERRNRMSVVVSGATTLAASDDWAALRTSVYVGDGQISHSFILSGLTAGTNTFTLNYKVQAGTVGGFTLRRISVVGIA